MAQRETERMARTDERAARPRRTPADIAASRRRKYRESARYNLYVKLKARIRKTTKGAGLADLMRSSLNRAGRSPKIEAILGYSIEDLRIHLEALFSEGMTWEAFRSGAIHLDHVRPLASFDVADPKQFRQAWGIANLQPLWAADNFAKRDRLDWTREEAPLVRGLFQLSKMRVSGQRIPDSSVSISRSAQPYVG